MQRNLAYGFLHEVSLSASSVESPLALNSANKQVDISSYSFKICFLSTEYHRGLALFIVMLSLTAHLHDIAKTLVYGKSPGHSKEDVDLICI